MWIEKLSVQNYKGFNEAQEINLSKGINIITGQNNAGKTALLEVLSLRFLNNPHRSIKTIPSVTSVLTQPSKVNVEVNLSRDELKDIVFSLGELRVPGTTDPIRYNSLTVNELFDLYFKNDVRIKGVYSRGNLISASLTLEKSKFSENEGYIYKVNAENKTIRYLSSYGGGDSSANVLANASVNVYLFKAERFNISHSPVGINSLLNSDASNLPEVLNLLQSNPIRFARFNQSVKRVFPQIHRVTTQMIDSSRVQIKVWTDDTERTDLTIPLHECGTGLGQVLSILYVVLNSDVPRVIIIDEPNSFLHPGASRKLIEILKEHDQHQFIISTHSTATIASANPKSIFLVKSVNSESIIEQVDLQETHNQQLYLAEIGARLSDVFGADNIMWVEGKTEEVCFPRIVDRIRGVSLMGTAILSVINTGDLHSRKKKELVYQVYKKLSQSSGLMPRAIGFLFDSEKLTDNEKANLRNESGQIIDFLPRAMFENYLLNHKAILFVLNQEPLENPIPLEKVSSWLDDNMWNEDYITANHAKGQDAFNWLRHCNGAKILKDLFSELSNHTLTFDKIRHSVLLCDWIIENSFDDLKEIQDLLIKSLKKG